ncbi:ATP-binding protein [Loigolactobacillus jiayinensis]|uniref:ATP-binding protein n=1 Tax=Loigolactobacillus jiayinensis TaxID=2486016 RepID=A0ABW1RC59_9LACO|nr:ATP-binding protein [Loigolactobacillus jiayinensis]
MIKRTTYLNRLSAFKDNEQIKVITGVRRCGKSILMQQYRDYLLSQGIAPANIIYLNFEDFELQQIRTEAQLHDLLGRTLKRDVRQYLLLDEVQFVTNWQRVINGVRVSFNCDIVLTGSNAMMLSGELATLLSGRYVQIPIYPLSFDEFLTAKAIAPDTPNLDNAFNEYSQYGGFPTVVLAAANIKDAILSGIYDSILLKDVAMRANVRDISVLQTLVGFLADNVGQLINPNKIANTLTSAGQKTNVHTIERYLKLLSDAFLFYRVQQYDLRGRNYLRSTGKYFVVDNGLRRTAISQRQGNFSNQLENIVFIELKRRGYTIDIGKIDTAEIDFIARKADDILYVQVTYELPHNNHETDNLLQIPDNYRKIVITQRHYEFSEIAGIPIININDWLLETPK